MGKSSDQATWKNGKTQGDLETTTILYFKRTRSTAENQDKWSSSSEALMTMELEVDNSLYLEYSSENEYVWGRKSDIKSKTV